MTRIRPAAVFLTVLCLAPAASAGTASVESRLAFRNDHAANNTPTGDTYTIGAAGTHEFQVLFGHFNAQGFTSGGTFNCIGTLDLNDPLGNASMAPRPPQGRRHPYNYGQFADGAPGDPITFDANRGFDSFITVPWEEGQPQPTPDNLAYSTFDPGVPGSGGAPDEYFPGYRFNITVTDLTPRTVTVDLSAIMQAIIRWGTLTVSPPEDGPGSVTFLPVEFTSPNLTTSATLTLHIIPAPAAAALLGLGGFAVSRRRRA